MEQMPQGLSQKNLRSCIQFEYCRIVNPEENKQQFCGRKVILQHLKKSLKRFGQACGVLPRLVDSATISQRPSRGKVSVIDLAANGLIFIDDGGKITCANQISEEMLGHGHKSIVGVSVTDILPKLFPDTEEPKDAFERFTFKGRVLRCLWD